VNVQEMWEEVTTADHVDDIHTANPEYRIRVEVDACDEAGEKETLAVVGVRWDHNEQMMVIETEA
jgi:hypothetical protein